MSEKCDAIRVPFCTCNDRECPNNPCNQPRGCTPCIAKCLHFGEIPTCLFRDVADDLADREDWSYEGFVEHVISHRK